MTEKEKTSPGGAGEVSKLIKLLANCVHQVSVANANTREVTKLTWESVVRRSRQTGFLAGIAGAVTALAILDLIRKAREI